MEVKVTHQSKREPRFDTIGIFDDDKREIAIGRLQVKRLIAMLKKVQK